MARHLQARATRGSQKWLQDLVNDCPELLDAAIRREASEISAPIEWVSPLARDGFAEYRDAEFLKRLGVSLNEVPLDEFWPSRGPQWDALGKTRGGQVILVEAKAHVEEMVSAPTQASPESRALIRESLKSVKRHVKSRSTARWPTSFYQYNNRLAHLYLLRTLNGIDAFLVNLRFLNANEMASERTVVPKTVDEWKAAITLQERFLGIRPKHALSRYAIHAFVDTRDIAARGKSR